MGIRPRGCAPTLKTTPLVLAAIVLLGVLAINPAEAQNQALSGAADDSSSCGTDLFANVARITSVIDVGVNIWHSSNPGCGVARTDTSVLTWVGNYNGPIVLGAGNVVATTWSFSSGGGLVGCTVSDQVNSMDTLGGIYSTSYAKITMTSDHCRGLMSFSIAISFASSVLYVWRAVAPIDIRVMEAPVSYLCAATGGVPDAYSPTSSTCNAPTLNTVQSGTLNVAQSGSWTITDDEDGWLMVNSGGQTISVSSWPQLQAVLSGSVGVDILDDTTDDGQLTTPMSNVSTIIGNQSITIPDSFNVTTQNGNLVGGLPAYSFGLLLFWIIALLFFAYQAWWFSLGFSIPGLLEVLFPAAIPEDFTVWFVFCLLGVLTEVAANRFQWGYYKNRNQTRS